jgi:NADPH:quinone reductase-like Zn-dependent oxidoreductase
MSQKALVASKYGAPTEVLSIDKSFPIPVPKDNEYLIEIHAVSLNPIDNGLRNGYIEKMYGIKYSFPLQVGFDFAGVISSEIKDGKYKKGDRVYGELPFTQPGSVAQWVATADTQFTKIPSHLSFEEAASLPLVLNTVVQSFQRVKLEKGSKVFISNGSGGTGQFAIQYATNVLGLDVYTKVGQRNIEAVKKLGAKNAYDYKTFDWKAHQDEYDLVFVNGLSDSADQLIQLVKPKGNIVSVTIEITTEKATFQRVTHQGTYVAVKESEEFLNKGLVKATIEKVYDFDHVIDAVTFLESGRVSGKLVIKIK